MRGALTMSLGAHGPANKAEFLTSAEKKRMIWALQQVLKNPEIGTMYKLAKVLGCTYPTVYKWYNGQTIVGSRYVKLLAQLSLGKAEERDFRPDVFYDVK